MEQIYPAYKEADIVVLASPLYYWTISGQLKMTFDRLFAVAEESADYANPIKESVLLMAAEGNGFEESEYWYDRLMNHLGWTSLGKKFFVEALSSRETFRGMPSSRKRGRWARRSAKMQRTRTI